MFLKIEITFQGLINVDYFPKNIFEFTYISSILLLHVY